MTNAIANQGRMRLQDLGACPVCGARERRILYHGLTDRLFGAPGAWTVRHCSDCGVAYLDPRPAEEDLALAYPAAYGNRKVAAPPGAGSRNILKQAVRRGFLSFYGYAIGAAWWDQLLAAPVLILPPLRRRLAFRFLGLRLVPDGRLLDVGSGVGGFLGEMAQLGWRAEGVETDPAVVAQCRARGLTVTEGNLESAAFPSDTFDAIALKHVIEHVPNPGGLLKECRRILKPGGRVVILTPNLVSAGHRALAAHWLGLEVPRHLVVFNRGALVGLANRAGLRLLEARSSSRPSSFIWVISDTLRRQDQNAYFVPASKMVRLRAALFAAGVWLRLLWNADAGDELMVVLTK